MAGHTVADAQAGGQRKEAGVMEAGASEIGEERWAIGVGSLGGEVEMRQEIPRVLQFVG
jgi:hypothetical protein